jgi:hypothetical protein
MAKQQTAAPKKKSASARETGEKVTLSLPPDMLAGVDQFCAEHDVDRPQAVRLIVEDWMSKHLVIRGE